MKFALAAVALTAVLFAPFSRACETARNWECVHPTGSYSVFQLNCGGAYVGEYKSALECVQARKRICGTSEGEYSCNWGIGYSHVELTCGGAYMGKFKTPLACIKAKRKLCD